MKTGELSPFQHQPYDGSSQPFTVGLRPILEGDWLEPDGHLAKYLAEKEQLIAHHRDDVFRAEEETLEAQREVLDLILNNLGSYHTETHLIDSDAVEIRSAGSTVSLSGEPALLVAARLVQEDLVLMRAGEEGYRLAAAVLCFPSSWSLAEKFRKPMSGIHETVPGFNEGRMGRVVARLFENLKADQLLCRFNWSIYPDDQLHQPLPERLDLLDAESALAQVFLRVERQTLRRLPETGDILFTIRIHHDPMAALRRHDDSKALSRSLRDQLLGLDTDQLAYKGMKRSRDVLARALEQLSE